jgi:hypothetical protein
MMTFAFRNDRRNLVVEAIDACDERIRTTQDTLDALAAGDPRRPVLQQKVDDLEVARTTLDAERAELIDDRWEVGDESARAIATDWLWNMTASLHDAIKADHALVALERDPLTTVADAAAIEAIPRGAADPRPGFFDEVSSAVGENDAVRKELVGVALGSYLSRPESDRAYPFREIGVMLPLRIETLFDELPDGTWQLSLRIAPDEPSIHRHQQKVTKEEARWLMAFWDRSRVMNPATGATPADWLEHAEGIVAWQRLSDRVGSPRAAWLTAEFVPTLNGGAFKVTIPPARIGAQAPDRVSGLPQQITIVAIITNGEEIEVGSLEPDVSKLRLPALRKSTPAAAGVADQLFDSWLVSWARAKAVGTGGEFRLPPGCTPDTIKALYAYGLGDDSPAAHFRAHAEAGDLGLLRLGAATNAVHGAPAADLADDAESWRAVAVKRLRQEHDSSIDEIAAVVCGDAEALPFLPGTSSDLNDARRMVTALWPALWGHFFRDLWKCADDGHTLGLWAMEALTPEGPLLPIRVATQPYGLLPVTSLDGWQPSDTSNVATVEAQLVDALLQLRATWSGAAVQRGTIVDADTPRLLELLARTGVSARYVYRPFLTAEQLAAAYPAVPPATFTEAADSAWRPAADVLRHRPSRAYLAIGDAQPLDLPLIGANRMPRATLKEIFGSLYGRGLANPYQEPMLGVLPDSLLVRLLLYSAMLSKAWYVQSADGLVDPVLNKLLWDDMVDRTPLEILQDRFGFLFETGAGRDPAATLLERQMKATFDLATELDQYHERVPDPENPQGEVARLNLPAERKAQLERALRATLDTAGHRLDPWATGVAWRRVRQHSISNRRLLRLGAYGWLEGPFLGTPGPNAAGRLHAPSHAQALTSIILRDKFLASSQELAADGRNIWKMDLESTGVRLAIEMADEVRSGFHIFEVVGRRVEGIVGQPDRVRALRTAAPLRPEKPDMTEVCQGLTALDALLAGSIPGVLSPDDSAPQIEALGDLKRALENYSDLLVAEGVHRVVTGHADTAADAMDAAAGFSRPPELQFPRTPPSGYRLATSVLAVFPHHAAVAEGTALELVDASLAAFLANRFRAMLRWSWRAQWTDDSVDPPIDNDVTVALADLSLKPLDVVLVPEDFLTEAVRTHLGAPATATIVSPASHRLMRQLAGVLGTRPVSLSDIVSQSDLAADILQQSESGLRSDLLDRYKKTRTAAAAFVAEMSGAAVTNAQRIDWLRRALGWGIVGPADTSARTTLLRALFGADAVPASAELLALTTSASAALTARLTNTPDHDAPETAALSVVNLAQALAQLAAPDGRLTITSTWSVATLTESARLETDAADGDIDHGWLTVVAAVRPGLARLEALQLEAQIQHRFEPLSAWSSAPGDPWQTGLVGQNVSDRAAGGITSIRTNRFVAAYGPAGAWEGVRVAAALVDQFSEAIPMAERKTFAAFGFNAPAARAPQAILLAVPPQSNRRLEQDHVLQILKETHQLVHARGALPDDVTAQPLAPTSWFQAAGPLRVRLDTGTEWYR